MDGYPHPALVIISPGSVHSKIKVDGTTIYSGFLSSTKAAIEIEKIARKRR